MPSPTRDFAATTFIVQEDRTLLLWHKKYHSWFPPGGHIERDELPDVAAVREVREETGLKVELLGEEQRWGRVTVLPTPICILLEEISEDHQHVDLIYFARVVGGKLHLNTDEALEYRWYTHADLAGPEIAEDIRILGRQAIERLGSG